MRKVITIIVGILLVLALVLTGLKSLFNSVFDDFKAEGWTMSHSANESRQRGLLLAELIADPSEPVVKNSKIRFAEVWMEEKSLSTHRFAWFPFEKRTGEYVFYCVIPLDAVGDPYSLHPVDKPTVGTYTRIGDREFFYLTLKTRGFADLRFSTERDPQDLRAKTIRFVQKP